MIRHRVRGACGALLSSLLLCFPAPHATAGGTPSRPSDGDAILARTAHGDIDQRALDRFLLSLPSDQRNLLLTDGRPGRDALAAMVVTRELLRQARQDGLDRTPAFRTRARLARLRLAAASCLRRMSVAAEPPGEDTLRAEYQRRSQAFQLPERRGVYHLFLGGDPESVEPRLQSLRQQVLDGAYFPNLAEQHSESETRHRRGKLAPGLITRDSLPPDLEELVFGLAERTPSAPLLTPHGGHIFWVETALPAQQINFETARPQLLAEWRAQQVIEQYRELDLPEALWRPASAIEADILQALESGEADDTLATLADGPLTLGELRAATAAGAAPGKATGERPVALSRALRVARLDDAVTTACHERGLLDHEQLEQQWTDWRRERLEAMQREAALMRIAGEDQGALRDFYAGNLGYFSDAPRWKLRQLTLPIGDDAVALFRKLEAATGAGRTALSELATAYEGELRELPAMTARELGQLWPELPERVSGFRAGQRLPPVKTGDSISVFEVDAFHPPGSRPFGDILDAVTRLYARQHASRLYAELQQRLLERVRFELLVDPGIPGPENEP